MPPDNGPTILLVEDDPVLLDSLEELLLLSGLRVLTATTAERALMIGRQQGEKVDVLVTDIALPGASGVDLRDGLQKRQPQLQTVFMSGYSRETAGRFGDIEQEGVRFLMKPVSPTDLIDLIQELVCQND